MTREEYLNKLNNTHTDCMEFFYEWYLINGGKLNFSQFSYWFNKWLFSFTFINARLKKVIEFTITKLNAHFVV